MAEAGFSSGRRGRLAFLVLRGLNLWYWRIKELLDTLHQMDEVP